MENPDCRLRRDGRHALVFVRPALPGRVRLSGAKSVWKPCNRRRVAGGNEQIVYHEIIGRYGFGSTETPGLESAILLASFDPQLDPHFNVYTSDPQAAQQYLAWPVAPLVDWASRYPLKQIQPTRELFGQLVAMICPHVTYVASMGNMIPEAVQELADLGVALVKGK